MNVGGNEVVVEIQMTRLTPEDAVGSRGVPSKAVDKRSDGLVEGEKRGNERRRER